MESHNVVYFKNAHTNSKSIDFVNDFEDIYNFANCILQLVKSIKIKFSENLSFKILILNHPYNVINCW